MNQKSGVGPPEFRVADGETRIGDEQSGTAGILLSLGQTKRQVKGTEIGKARAQTLRACRWQALRAGKSGCATKALFAGRGHWLAV
jgi:hypothetical protein